MKTNTNPFARRGFTLVELLVVIVIIAALAGLTAPMVMRQQKKAATTEATSNARQLFLALFEFDTEYGTYPDSETAEEVRKNTETNLNLGGNYSNDYFRQLIAAGISDSEQPFYAKTANSPRKPDNVMTGSDALKAGEVGFGYLMNGQYAFSSSGSSGRPIAVAPLIGNSTGGEFDPEPYDGKAIVLKLDGSATALNILPNTNQVNIGGGRLLETGPNTVWGGNVNPIIAPPEQRGGGRN
jgi:type II secretion system protein G